MDQTTLPGGATYTYGDQDINIKVLGDGTVYAGDGNDTIDVDGSGYVQVGNGNDVIIIGTDPGPGFVFAGDGMDNITLANGGEVYQIGASGQDTITLGSGNDTIFEQGTASVVGTFGEAFVQGGEFTVNQAAYGSDLVSDISANYGNVTMVGGNETTNNPNFMTEFDGSSGANVVMLGGTGINIFDAGTGNDTMAGGVLPGTSTAPNFYQFDAAADQGGNTVVSNFVSGRDQLYLDGQTLAFLKQNNEVSVQGGNTLITLDGGKTHITLTGVTNLQSYDVSQTKLGGSGGG